jgi:hypothetical protein
MERLRPASDKIIRLAALLTLVEEDPTTEAGQRAFWAFKALFLNGARLPRWDSALQHIPPDRRAIMRVVDACHWFGHYAGPGVLAKGHLMLDQVVGVMMEIDDPQGYIAHAARTDFLKPGALFHPNTLAAARNRMRGSLGVLGRDREQHNNDVNSRIRIVKATGQ